MKASFAVVAAVIAWVAGGCDEPKPPVKKTPPEPVGVAALKVPENVPPPVETQPYEDGFAAGGKAGEAAARARKGRGAKTTPSDEEIAVIALEAAGANPDRGPKWQQGFVSGYRYDFERITKGLR